MKFLGILKQQSQMVSNNPNQITLQREKKNKWNKICKKNNEDYFNYGRF